jgi:hypothetical protein
VFRACALKRFGAQAWAKYNGEKYHEENFSGNFLSVDVVNGFCLADQLEEPSKLW